MKFCDKLPKLRKENNLSQELLADKLGVSRQAVSKWESGSSYPDMEKMIEMCKILNCTLEDLLDDGSIGGIPNSNSNNNKFNFNNYVHDFLKFVTKMYNMLCAMSFKDKIKCLLEMTFIAIVLWILIMVVCFIFDSLLFSLFNNIPKIGYTINFVLNDIFTILLSVVALIIFIHLFKIRYLDYYVTVEDQNAKEKILEKPIEEKAERKETNPKKERIIIRDPKHSKFSFFECLAKIVIVIMKIMLLMFAIPVIIIFIALNIGLFMSIYHIKFGIIFLFSAISFLGLLGLNYVVIEFIFNFIISKKQNFKRIFIIIISGLILFGAGLGLSACIYLGFDKTNEIPKTFQTENTLTLEMTDNTILDPENIIYKIDNSSKDITLKSKYSTINAHPSKVLEQEYNFLYIYPYQEENKLLNILYYDIKNKRTRDYNKLLNSQITATVSKETYNKLTKNYNKYLKESERYNEYE